MQYHATDLTLFSSVDFQTFLKCISNNIFSKPFKNQVITIEPPKQVKKHEEIIKIEA